VQLARVLAQIAADDASGGAARVHRYLFLDEPTTSLDVHHQLHLLDIVRGLLQHDCTIVAILHDLNVAFAHGDRFLLLDGGRVAREYEHAADVDESDIERVFRVRARRVQAGGVDLWRFSLTS
jgi:iron complex transport system ATP-binding protein